MKVCFIQIIFLTISTTVPSNAQVLFQCDFDSLGVAANCFRPGGLFQMLITDKFGSLGVSPPSAPYSDVTSSLKPTSNNEPCKLPYRVGTYTWDMYFCNNGFCPTALNPTTPCKSGKFAYHNLYAARADTFLLFTGDSGINGINGQCLTYYHFLPNISNIQQSIVVIKEEADVGNTTIDSVTRNSFNGWIKREVNYMVLNTGYKIFFRLEKATGSSSSQTVIGLDEITIAQGRCTEESTTTTTISTASTDTTTTTSTTTTTVITTTTTRPTTATALTETITTTTVEHTSITTSLTVTTTTPTATITTTTTPTATTTTTTVEYTSSTTLSSLTTSLETTTTSSTVTTSTTTDKLTTTTTGTTSTPEETSQPITTRITSLSTGSTGSLSSHVTIVTSIESETPGSNNNMYVIIVGVVVPVVLIGVVSVYVWKTRCTARSVKRECDGIEFDTIPSSSSEI